MEDLIGVDGEERDAAAQQHGNQVEGAGPEDDFFPPDKLGPGKHVARGALPGGAGRRVEAADRTEQPQKRAPERGPEQIDDGEIGESDKKPAEGEGAGHRGDFERTRVPRDRIAEAFVRQKQRRDTGAGRPDQNADACVGAEQGKHQRQRGLVGLQRGRIAVALEQEGDAPQGRIGPAERGERRDARAEVGQALVQAIELRRVGGMDRPVQRVVESRHRQICRDDVEKVSRANAVRGDNAVGGGDGACAGIQRGQRSGESRANPLAHPVLAFRIGFTEAGRDGADGPRGEVGRCRRFANKKRGRRRAGSRGMGPEGANGIARLPERGRPG